MGEMIKLTTKDGATIGAYKAVPEGKPRGGMVVLQEIFGVNHHIRNVTDRFAAQGYLAIAPALFDRVGPDIQLGYNPDDVKQGAEVRAKTKIEESLADVEAAIAAASAAGPVGVIGFCWGGTLAYAAATHFPVAAAVGYYGGGIATIIADKLKAPVELHFGEQDTHIPMSDVEKIKTAHPGMPVYVYPAGHGFNCDERGSYDKASADIARTRSLEFFARHIKA
jgi:carboxymethylenebutenolidase